jgi:hypothetical protein
MFLNDCEFNPEMALQAMVYARTIRVNVAELDANITSGFLPVSGKLKPRTPLSPPPGGEGLGVGGTPTEKKKHRHGRPRKTGRPGQ